MNLPVYRDFQANTNPNLAISSPAGVVAGTTLRAEFSRENPIEEIIIRVTGTVGVAAATMNPDRIFRLIKRVQLTVNDGGTPRTIVDASGSALIEHSFNEVGSVDADTAYSYSAGRPSLTAFQFDVPLKLAHPQLPDPLRSLTLLPVHLHRSNPVLTIDIASRAEIDVNGTPTLTITSPTVDVITSRRIIGNDFDQQIAKFGGYWNYDLLMQELGISATGEVNHEIVGPGLYSNLLLQTYNSTSARTSSANTYDQWNTTQGQTIVQIKQGIQSFEKLRLRDVLAINERSRDNVVLMDQTAGNHHFSFRPYGSYFWDRLTEEVGADGSKVSQLGSMLFVNPGASGQRTYLNFPSYTGGAGIMIRTLGRRFSLDTIAQAQTAAKGA